MPWVKDTMCTGCGVCVEECPVDAIAIASDTALIDDSLCIRCGRCHDICPQEAVRHDSEHIPQDIEANIAWTNRLLEHFDTNEEKNALIERMIRYFTKEKKISDRTIAQLEDMRKEL